MELMELMMQNRVLEAERIRLRPFTMEDADDMFLYASDAEVVKYLTWDGYKSIEDLKEFLASKLEDATHYAIELKAEQKVIGAIDLRLVPEHNKASFGYCLNRAYWNKGYMSEALARLMAFGFDVLGLNRIESTFYRGNEASGRVMEKCGMVREGFAEQEELIKGKYVDIYHLGILRSRYNTLKNQ